MKLLINNISLDELAEREFLSNRSRHICEVNNFTDVQTLLNYYYSNYTFINLKNCGRKSDEELKKICAKYSSYLDFEEKLNKNTSINEIAVKERLSYRSENICISNNINDINTLLKHYIDNRSFYHLRKCGSKSNSELIKICKKYKNIYEHQQKFNQEQLALQLENEKENIIQIIDDLTATQKNTLNIIIETQFKGLSSRSFNALSSFYNSRLNVKNIKTILSENPLKLKNIKNFGQKSVKEFAQLQSAIIKQISIINNFLDEKELTVELFNYTLEEKLNVPIELIEKINDSYDFSKGLPIFKTISLLFENNVLYNHKETEILKHSFNIFNNTELITLEKLGNQLGITRERIRQLRNYIYENFNLSFSFLKSLEIESINLFGIDLSTNIVIIDNEIVDNINLKEGNSFNRIFINKVLSILLAENYVLIGNEENILFNKGNKEKHRWSQTYLIKKELAESFNFEYFVEDIAKRRKNRIAENYSFHFEAYIQQFAKNKKFTSVNEIIECTEHILFSEFEMTLDTYGNIIFRRNTRKQVIEYVYEVLEQEGKPLSIYEIYNRIDKKHPNVVKSVLALKGSCNNDKRNIIYFGRSSTFGLKKWEKLNLYKGGTMHDISEEFLLKFNVPKHINEIVEYVSNYRTDVTTLKLKNNLISAKNRRFTFYKNNYVGLVNKKYAQKFVLMSKENNTKKSWDENYSLLEDFINKNDRLPTSTDESEGGKLYNFMRRKISDKQRKIKIDELFEMFGKERKKRNSTKRNTERFKEIKKFIIENKRLPKASIPDENLLYQFYKRHERLNKKNELTNEQKIRLNEVFKLISELI